ncbi:MAG: hypothetical protein HY766_10305, partial [candidate division NC10 bacterium]|nr:hypothetical protein [candidate division NC10 bacterium]
MGEPTIEHTAIGVKDHPAQQDLPGGYAGAILRVDLTSGRIWTQLWTPEEMRQYLGGTGLGARLLWE